ncbi:MAG: glycine-rich protein, partial [Crocinitomicaceae bacterium]|nr:glycine-rich protein [Crocinitomicaceae bacterium]
MKNIYTIILFLFISLFNNGFSQPQTVTFNYTGAAQSWTVPPCVYNISVSVKGAQGGGPGGLGATVLNPSIAVTPGQVLQINVGQNPTGPTGGWNGGGNGFEAAPVTYQSYGGGGASDIRITPYALTNRIVVAGGGGGKNGCSPQYNAIGGAGGCVTGMTGAGSPFVGVGGGG